MATTTATRRGKTKATAEPKTPKPPKPVQFKLSRDTGVKIGDITYRWHAIANVFPLIPEDGEEFASLVTSLKVNGQREPIRTYGADEEGRIYVLDGRNRLLAAKAAKRDPVLVEFTGDEGDAAAYVHDENVIRRNLTTAQKVAAINKLRDEHKLSVRLIAKTLGVSKSAAGRAVRQGSGEGTVTGADGRQHAASRPSTRRTPPPRPGGRALPDPRVAEAKAEAGMRASDVADKGLTVLKRVAEALEYIDPDALASALRLLGDGFYASIETAELLEGMVGFATGLQTKIANGPSVVHEFPEDGGEPEAGELAGVGAEGDEPQS